MRPLAVADPIEASAETADVVDGDDVVGAAVGGVDVVGAAAGFAVDPQAANHTPTAPIRKRVRSPITLLVRRVSQCGLCNREAHWRFTGNA